MTLPTDKQHRKERPIARGVLDYFPDAIAAVANLSFVGNQQHNPGEEMHWARDKSSDHADCVARHLIERGHTDDDGVRHSTKVAWRALAMLQIELEEAGKLPTEQRTDSNSGAKQKTEPKFPYQSFTATYRGSEPAGEKAENQTWEDILNGPRVQVGVDYASDQFYHADPARLESWREAMRQSYKVALVDGGCTESVATLIAKGTSFPTPGTYSGRHAYIAGPMRGYEQFNFPAFDRLRNRLLRQGWAVISPADIDRHGGLDENDDRPESIHSLTRDFVYRDFHAIHSLRPDREDALMLLSGWENSIGAVAEFFLARWLGIQRLAAATCRPIVLDPITIAQERSR